MFTCASDCGAAAKRDNYDIVRNGRSHNHLNMGSARGKDDQIGHAARVSMAQGEDFLTSVAMGTEDAILRVLGYPGMMPLNGVFKRFVGNRRWNHRQRCL